jgi:hypothetical protein
MTQIQCIGSCSRAHSPEYIVQCEAGHSLCYDDAKKYTQTQINKGYLVIKCFDPSCTNILPGKEVLRFIDLKIFAGLTWDGVEEMIERLGLVGLAEICPNCMTVVACGPIEQNSELKCTKTECKNS